MSEAPERIWAEPGMPGYTDEPNELYTVEYVRADRIEELEAKLARAVEHLEHLVYLQSGNPCTGIQAEKWLGDALTTLAELTGGNDDL